MVLAMVSRHPDADERAMVLENKVGDRTEVRRKAVDLQLRPIISQIT